jgi:hypothetical protein
VTHASFGHGEVEAADLEAVTVVFAHVGKKVVDPAYLTAAQAPPAAAAG